MGGKLGDFLHSLYAVKEISKLSGSTANVYMYDIGWEFGIHNSYTELKPILEMQSYINKLSILENYELNPIQTSAQNTPIKVYDIKLCINGYIDLGSYIRSEWLYKVCWSELYSKTFGFNIDKEDMSWISYPKIDKNLIGKVLIHRRHNSARLNTSFPYHSLLERYGNRAVFVGSSNDDYIQFPYKDLVEFYKISTLDEWFTAINTCDLMISNLTGPAVIAHSMNKQRIIELPNTADAIHCIGEEKYSSNIQWYLSENLHTL